MRTMNPALNERIFRREAEGVVDRPMTVEGTVHRTAILLGLVVLSGFWAASRFAAGTFNPAWMYGSAIGGLVVAMITIFSPRAAPFTAPIYALLEGVFLGAISMMYASLYEGIVIHAVMLTLGIFAAVLIAYATGVVRATPTFRKCVIAATMGIFLVYLVSFIMGFFGASVPFIHESGLLGIGFSLFVIVIASMNLVLDFDFIEQGSRYGLPKRMEWYAAFGLLVTLIWLYIEVLRLLAKLQRR